MTLGASEFMTILEAHGQRNSKLMAKKRKILLHLSPYQTTAIFLLLAPMETTELATIQAMLVFMTSVDQARSNLAMTSMAKQLVKSLEPPSAYPAMGNV